MDISRQLYINSNRKSAYAHPTLLTRAQGQRTEPDMEGRHMTKNMLLLTSVTSYNYRVLCVHVTKSFIKRKCSSLTTEGWPPG